MANHGRMGLTYFRGWASGRGNTGRTCGALAPRGQGQGRGRKVAEEVTVVDEVRPDPVESAATFQSINWDIPCQCPSACSATPGI